MLVAQSLWPHGETPLSMRFSRQEYWSGLRFPSPGDLPNHPEIKPGSPTLQADSLPSEPPEKPLFPCSNQNETWMCFSFPHLISSPSHCQSSWYKLQFISKPQQVFLYSCIFHIKFLSLVPSWYYCCSVSQSCLTLCNPMDCSTPDFPVHHHLLELAQTHVHRVGDAIQPSHPLLSPSPPAFNLSQHQGLFKWVSSSHQVSKVLGFQLQHQSSQCIFWTDFL